MEYSVEGGASLHSPGNDGTKRRVCYFFDDSIGDYDYGKDHPMKPFRIHMAHELICKYKLHRKMQIIKPFPAGKEDIGRFHSSKYVEFLSSVSPETLNVNYDSTKLNRFNVGSEGSDCPAFDGLFEFCQASAGGSIGAAAKLNQKDADIAINWAGGLHHAHKTAASGFCYVNDIVLGILELLKVHRVNTQSSNSLFFLYDLSIYAQ